MPRATRRPGSASSSSGSTIATGPARASRASSPRTRKWPERLTTLDREIRARKYASTVVLADRYRANISYTAKPVTEIATIEEGSAGLAGGATKPAEGQKPAEEPKKKGFGLGSLLKPAGTEKKSAEVTGSAASRGVDTERNARGGPVKTMVAVKVTPAEVDGLQKEEEPQVVNDTAFRVALGTGLLLLALAVRAASVNRLVRRKLRLSFFLALVYTIVSVALGQFRSFARHGGARAVGQPALHGPPPSSTLIVVVAIIRCARSRADQFPNIVRTCDHHRALPGRGHRS